MALSDLTDREAVLAAIREYDDLGRDQFLAKYGFGRAKHWMLIQDGREYDSKAISGVAHGIQHPELGPLTSADFTGGRHSTVSKLRSLGFDVKARGIDAMPDRGTFEFVREDCGLFAKYPKKVPFRDDLVPPEDKARFKDVWTRVKALAAYVADSVTELARDPAEAPDTRVPLKAEGSLYAQNGYSQTDLWACAYPAVVPNKSYGLQVAFIISATGAELCFCLGAGQSQLSDPDKKAQAEAALASVKEALQATPSEVREQVRRNLQPEWDFRKRWREPPGSRDFDDVDAWLAYAAGPDGNGASVSRNLTVEALEDMGAEVAGALLEMAEAFGPLLSYAYGQGGEAALLRAMSEYEAEIDQAELDRTRTAFEIAQSRVQDLFGTPEKVADLTAEDFFSFLNDVDVHVSKDTGLFTLGPGLQAPKDPALHTWKVLEEDLPQLRRAINTLLYGEPDEDLAHRIDAMLAGPKVRRYITPDLALPTILLCFAGGERYSGIQRMPKKEEKLRAMGLLPELPVSVSVGERFVAYETVLADLPARYGKDWDWAMQYVFYWSAAFERNLVGREAPTGEGVITPPVRPSSLEDLADELYVDAAFLEEVIALLNEKRQVIFFGPPGTGKTYIAQKLIAWLAPEEERRDIVQFHPSYSYEDFVLGFRPFLTNETDLAYQLQHGPLLRLAQRAATNPDQTFVLLIDEINRGNLPRIFGELLFLLEYRNQKVSLMYAPPAGVRQADSTIDDQGKFALPDKLWLVGTMNTADRSIGLIDAALRRRFHFVPFFPNEGPLRGLLRRWLEDTQTPEMQQVADWVDRLNERLRKRFGRHLQVGHSYFMRETLTLENVERIWATDIMPFLEDQLFDQEAKLRQFTLDAIRKGDGEDAGAGGDADDVGADSDALVEAGDDEDGEDVEYADDSADRT